jgi:DNA (cytosine-5)-methyltransferase 1
MRLGSEESAPVAAQSADVQLDHKTVERSRGRARKMTLGYYEFFAGGGMARAGLGPNFTCLLANDIDLKKARSYATNWGEQNFVARDVAQVRSGDLPGRADLVWASFPCQDLSLAGAGAGLDGDRSGTFWTFWNLMKVLRAEKRAPRTIVLENVKGALTSHGGRDFAAIGEALTKGDYRFGAVLIDAVHFLPQSRPRLFIVAIDKPLAIPAGIIADKAVEGWHSQAVVAARSKLSLKAQEAWIWWRLPRPPMRNSTFADVLEDDPKGVHWHTEAETKRSLELMTPVNLEKVKSAKRDGKRIVGTLYRRTRDAQRAEVRFDGAAGCLRTPAGGSSRQTIVIVEGESVRSRLLSPREAARLMGLPDDYVLPSNYNEAYHLAGDGVAVPVVRFLASHILEPVLAQSFPDQVAAE